MALEFSFKTELDPVALYAASVATLALAWNITTALREGAKLIVDTTPNMIISNNQNSKFVTVRAKNNGTRTTTLESVCFSYWPNFWAKFTNKKMKNYAVLNTCVPMVGNCELPFELEPGKKWTGFIEQTEELEQLSKAILSVDLYHSASKKPIKCKVSNITSKRHKQQPKK